MLKRINTPWQDGWLDREPPSGGVWTRPQGGAGTRGADQVVRLLRTPAQHGPRGAC